MESLCQCGVPSAGHRYPPPVHDAARDSVYPPQSWNIDKNRVMLTGACGGYSVGCCQMTWPIRIQGSSGTSPPGAGIFVGCPDCDRSINRTMDWENVFTR